VLHPVAHLSSLASYDAVNRKNVPVLTYWNFVAIDGVIGSQVGLSELISSSMKIRLVTVVPKILEIYHISNWLISDSCVIILPSESI
jgi:hypothetical protein